MSSMGCDLLACTWTCTQVLDEKQTTVYKRALDTQYNLKLKVSGQSGQEGQPGARGSASRADRYSLTSRTAAAMHSWYGTATQNVQGVMSAGEG
jgi:hypothetical protein